MEAIETTEAILALQPEGEVWRFSVTGNIVDAATFGSGVTWEGATRCTWDQLDTDAAIRSVALAGLRGQRDKRLAETDWTQMPDRPDDDAKTAWATYRQALRNLPATTADPTDPSWPTPPE